MLRFLLRRFRPHSSQPLLPSVTVTAAQLGIALHAVVNDGRTRLYGTDRCPHEELANRVFGYLADGSQPDLGLIK